MKLNIGPGPHYQDGWVNVDVKAVEGIFKADVYVEDPMVLPFEDNVADEIYAAHILEHIQWEKVPGYLNELHRVLKVGGQLIIIGPDVVRGIEMYKRGQIANLWYSDNDPGLMGIMEWPHLPDWDAPRHYWNCYEKRVLDILDPEKWESRPVDITSKELDPYPVVSRIGWQFAILARKSE